MHGNDYILQEFYQPCPNQQISGQALLVFFNLKEGGQTKKLVDMREKALKKIRTFAK